MANATARASWYDSTDSKNEKCLIWVRATGPPPSSSPLPLLLHRLLLVVCVHSTAIGSISFRDVAATTATTPWSNSKAQTTEWIVCVCVLAAGGVPLFELCLRLHTLPSEPLAVKLCNNAWADAFYLLPPPAAAIRVFACARVCESLGGTVTSPRTLHTPCFIISCKTASLNR